MKKFNVSGKAGIVVFTNAPFDGSNEYTRFRGRIDGCYITENAKSIDSAESLGANIFLLNAWFCDDICDVDLEFYSEKEAIDYLNYHIRDIETYRLTAYDEANNVEFEYDIEKGVWY